MKNNKAQYATDKVSVLPKSLVRDSNGFLRGDAYLTRTGVFPYVNPDGSVRYELRHPDDVFTQESLDSMKMVPLTKEHPYKPLNSDNTSYTAVGHLGDSIKVDEDGIRVIGPVLITDEDMIQEVENKERTEISMGYLRIIVEETGNYNGIPYTHRQKNIVYNHAAITKKGRAGSSIKLVTDSSINQDDYPELTIDNLEQMKEVQMIKINNVVYDSLTAEVVNEFGRLTQLAEDNATTITGLNTDLGGLTAKAQTAQDSLDAELAKDHSANIQEQVTARVKLLTTAQTVLAKDTHAGLNDLNDAQVKEKVIQAVNKDFNMDSLEGDDAFKAGYMSHAFDSALTALAVNAQDTANDLLGKQFKPADPAKPEEKDEVLTPSQAQDSMNERIYKNKRDK